jgi:predicted N-formylglutamate amidohydrolase
MSDIAAEQAEAFRVLPGRADSGLLLLADHAENTLPAEYGTLGLPPAELERHIAWDPGVRLITERLAQRLGAPAVLSRFSRLLIDPNRGPDDPTLVMRLSDGAIIPGNRSMDAIEVARRTARFHAPYHAAIRRVLDQMLATGVTPTVLSLHSFTPVWKGVARPWHVAVLWDRDPRLARPLIDAFAADRDLVVGDNQPYHGCLRGDTIWTHATQRGLPGAIVEYRQDLVSAAAGAMSWAERTEAILHAIRACRIAGPPLRRIERWGSRSDASPSLRRGVAQATSPEPTLETPR